MARTNPYFKCVGVSYTETYPNLTRNVESRVTFFLLPSGKYEYHGAPVLFKNLRLNENTS